jgi:hypothetical protein
MPDIVLPDGSIARFPEDATDAEIEAALREAFPPTQKAEATGTLQPGTRELVGEDGAFIVYSADLDRVAIYDGAGRLHGLRRDLAEARLLAQSIKAPAPRQQRRVERTHEVAPEIIRRDQVPPGLRRPPPRVILRRPK